MMTQSHPTPEALSDFVQGRLDEVELEQVSAHLGECSVCQRTLDQLSRANDTLIGKVRDAGAAIESAPGEANAKGSVAPNRPKPPVAPREPAATAGLVIKSVSWEQVQQILTDLELVSTEDLAALRQQLLAASSKELGSDALRELTDQGKLTKYQAQAIFQNKAHLLSYGEYTVLDRLGAGGMGQVFKAVHRRMRRIVALKVLSSSALKNPEAVRRFEREATAAAKLSHPAIVSAYDLNSHGKTSFLVMEYIEGRDLSKIVDSKGPLPVNTAIDYILQAAEALAFAHSHGIIHRDIKPANLLIDRDGRLKVLDLGLAKFEGAGGESSRTQLTVTAQVMGTVDYMAPEQALNTKKAEARSDIYSLGCTLYRLLTNQSVYDGETITERFLNHREAPIPSLRTLRPDVPESLDDLFRYMVGKKPEDRPATMAEVVRILEQINASPLASITALLPQHAVLASDDTIRKQGNQNQASFSATVVADLPLVVSAGKSAGRRKVKPPRGRHLFVAAGSAGVLFVLLGFWVIVRDSDGNKVVEVQVPKGGNLTVTTAPTTPTPMAPTANPTTPIAPVLVPNSPQSATSVSPKPSSQGEGPSKPTTTHGPLSNSDGTSSIGVPPISPPTTKGNPVVDSGRATDTADSRSADNSLSTNSTSVQPVELSREAGMERLRRELLKDTWYYLDNLFPPRGPEKFRENGSFGNWSWNYWVTGPNEIRIHYDRNNKDKDSGILFTFDNALTRFTGRFTDGGGKEHIVTGTRLNPGGKEARRGLLFSGAQAVLVSKFEYAGLTPLTVEAFVTANDIGDCTILGNNEFAGFGLNIYKNQWDFHFHDSKVYKHAMSDTPVVRGREVHLAGVCDGNTLRLYVNGQLQKAYATLEGKHRVSRWVLVLGGSPNKENRPEKFFRGLIRDVRITAGVRYRSSFEVPKTFAVDKSTVLFMPLDEGSGDIVTDRSPFSHTGTVINPIWLPVSQ